MKQSVPASFIAHVKYLLLNNTISTRELNRRLGKSISYTTKLLGGQIKTIEYDTAYNIIKILAPNMSNIDLWLIENFGIEPDSLIKQRIENAELEYERRLEEIKEAQELVDDIGKVIMDKLIGGEIQFESIELLKKIADKDLSNFGGGNIYRSIVDIQEHHPKEYRKLSIFVDELEKKTIDIIFGECNDTIQMSNGEKVFRDNIRNLLKEEPNEPDDTNN